MQKIRGLKECEPMCLRKLAQGQPIPQQKENAFKAEIRALKMSITESTNEWKRTVDSSNIQVSESSSCCCIPFTGITFLMDLYSLSCGSWE